MAFAALFQGTASTEHLDALKKSLKVLAEESLNEPGTLRYEFYQSEEEPTIITLFAIWENEADWKTHIVSDAHNRHVASLPEGAWAIPPKMTRLKSLTD